MQRLEIILLIILVILLISYVSFLAYVAYKIHGSIKSNTEGSVSTINSKASVPISIDINSPYQTDFFNKSAEYSEKVLFGKQVIQEYGEPQYYGNNLLDIIHKLNDETKKRIIIAIKYMCIEPVACRNNERAFRMIAENEHIPLWFIILKEAVKKVIPELIQTQNKMQTDNIVPLYKIGTS